MTNTCTEKVPGGKRKRNDRNGKTATSKPPKSDPNANVRIDSQVFPLLLPHEQQEAMSPDNNTPFIRIITPYPYTFTSHAKQRHIGKDIHTVYTCEFGAYPSTYYTTAIQQGRIQVSGRKVPTNYTIKNNDILSHTVHRHEPAVLVATNKPPYLTILANTDDVLVIDKPSTLPIHPCGAYHHNTVIGLLQQQLNISRSLFTIHRLDRLTSGLLILGKTARVAQEWSAAIQQQDDNTCEKVYVARVQGRFLEQQSKKLPLQRCCDNKLPENGAWDNFEQPQKSSGCDDETTRAAGRRRNALGFWIMDCAGNERATVGIDQLVTTWTHSVDDWLAALDNCNTVTLPAATLNNFLWFHMACPTRIEQSKNGVCACGDFNTLDDETYQRTVKPAETAFCRISYDALTNTSLVLCRPKTGRTHQIRIHLQFLGYPIANDSNYGGTMWFGNEIGERQCRRAQAQLNALDKSKNHHLVTTDTPATVGEIEKQNETIQEEQESLNSFIRRTCVWCNRGGGGHVDRTVLEFLVRSPGIWLHALKYSLVKPESQERISFRTELPAWATI
jgi:23S rRNA-/tRNA-specific pseudouridylate synthase